MTGIDMQVMIEPPAYNLPDLVALIVVLACGLRGWLRGLSGELARLATVSLALLLAMRLRKPLAALISGVSRLEGPADIALAFTLTAIVVLIVLAVVFRLLRRIMQVTFTRGLEKGGGLVAGWLRGALLVLTVFIMFNLWPHDYLNRVFGDESLLGRGVQRLLPTLRERWERFEPTLPAPEQPADDNAADAGAEGS